MYEQKTLTFNREKEKKKIKEKKKVEKKGMLAGAPTRVLELKVALKPFGPVACLFFFS